MAHEKFDIHRLERLNDPARLGQTDPHLMWDALGRPIPHTIVEIGAGTGLFAGQFAELAPGAVVYAVDTEPVMIEWMREHRVPTYGDRLVPVLSAEETVPLPDGVAEIVVMLNVHHELASPSAIYAEAYRLLSPGGQIAVADWAPGADDGGPSQAVRASAEHIATALEAAGFERPVMHAGLDRHSLLTASRP